MQECTCLHVVEDDLATQINLILIVVALPIISLVGLVFNVLSIIVFCEQRGSASSKYLAALSCSDVGVCIAGILIISSDSLRAHWFILDQLFVVLLPKIIPLGLFFQMLSVYVTVLAAFDCYVAVKVDESHFLPFLKGGEAVVEGRRGWAPRVLAGMVLCVALYNIVQFADLQAVECLHPVNNVTIYELCPTELRLNEDYVVIYKGYMYALSMAIIPFILLTILTFGILVQMRKKSKDEKKKDNSANILLLVIILFLFCNICSLLVNLFEMLKISFGQETEAILMDVGNFLVVVNATANFFIYWSTSPEYRESIRRKFKCLSSSDDVSNSKVDFV